MSLRRTLGIVLAGVGVLLLGAVLYLAFGDLGRFKGRIESLVTHSLGRPFAIDGAFQLRVLPQISVRAERVRLGNAPWGSKPQMIEVGHFALDVGLWSLVSGPIDVRSLELSDVSVLLEKDREGRGNWEFGGAEPEPAAALAPGATKIPAVVLHARLANVRISYRAPGSPERDARLESLTVDSGAGGLLAIDGKGGLGGYAASVSGEVGPLHALVSGRDIRIAMQAALADLRLDLKGSVGRLDPLDGADLALGAEHPDVGALLKELHLPALAAGSMNIDAKLADAGALTRLDANATFGDIKAKASGTLQRLGLPGADLRFETVVPNAARVAAAFGVNGLPASELKTDGRITVSQTEIKLEKIGVRFAGAKAAADGAMRLGDKPRTTLRFDFSTGNLAQLRAGLPRVPVSVGGNFADSPAGIELTNLKGRVGKSDFTARASMARKGNRHLEAELTSPRLDLTPLLRQEGAGKTKAKKAKYVFSEAALPLDALQGLDAKLHLAVGELLVASGALKDVDVSLIAKDGGLALEGKARGGISGSLNGTVALAPQGRGAADLNLELAARDLRTGISAGGKVHPSDVPAARVDANLRARGGSARQMAAGANGRFLVALGPGKVKSGVLGMVAGDLLGELFSKLNPFAAQDPYTRLDCLVARTDIVNGKATVAPVLMQSTKVTVVASGDIDLHDEALSLDFATRPRTGVGISAGMFANPFLRLGGTLASPQLGVGAKGAVAGAAAAATGGMTILAQGLWDRAQGSRDLCEQVLNEATAK